MKMRTLLHLASLTPSQLAERANVSRGTVYLIANERYSRLHWITVEKIGVALNQRFVEIGKPVISLAEFFEYVESIRDKSLAAGAK